MFLVNNNDPWSVEAMEHDWARPEYGDVQGALLDITQTFKYYKLLS